MHSSTSVLKVLATRRVPAHSVYGVFRTPVVVQCLSSHSDSSASSSGGVDSNPTFQNLQRFTASNAVSVTESVLSAKDNNEASEVEEDSQRATISKAMNSYLKRAKDHQEFMVNREKEFVFGRRHLANMMGKDPENFTQKDIDESIRYLFPSGLYEPRARPMMKPPQEVYPKQKAAQFDMSGRPHHPFFYTTTPNFFYLLHQMVGKLNALNKLAASKSGVNSPEDTVLSGTVWLTKSELEARLLEKISDQLYNDFVACLERIATHPKRDKELDFLKSLSKPLTKQTRASELPIVTLEPDGRKSVHIPLCMKKSARADVLVTVPGTGEFKINGKGLDYFTMIQSRQAVIAPLQLVDWLGKCDIEANAEGGTLACDHLPNGGETSRAIAVRWGIATALAALGERKASENGEMFRFLCLAGADMEKLRLAGYLAKDRRFRERNKCAHDGARAKWTWKKR